MFNRHVAIVAVILCALGSIDGAAGQLPVFASTKPGDAGHIAEDPQLARLVGVPGRSVTVAEAKRHMPVAKTMAGSDRSVCELSASSGAELGHNRSMKRTLAIAALTAAIGLQTAAPSLSAAEPLVGTWRLESQEINGQKGESEPLAFKVSQAGDKYSFAFSVLINELYVVTMKYTLRLDGSAADILTGSGEKIGTIQMTRRGGSQYTLVMKGPDRPESKGKITLSADGKTLITEADAVQSGRSTHSRQTFSRYQ